MWKAICRFDNLYTAYTKARKGKQNRPSVAEFSLHLEENLFQLQAELVLLSWQPGKYKQFTLYERKPRLISAAPFRDRVVHHAIMNQLEPEIDPLMYPHSYACRKHKGVHAAVTQYQHWAQHFTYVLKLDISRYFPSVDHAVLKQILSRYISDPDLLLMLGRIIDSYQTQIVSTVYPVSQTKGMPIGNLTSQFFANLYLDDLDHFIRWQLCANKSTPIRYLRYVDDMVLLANNKSHLWECAVQIQYELNKLKLELHPKKVNLTRTTSKLDLFGYQISRSRRWLRNDNGYRFRRRFKKMAQQFSLYKLDHSEIQPRIASWIGHAQHGETLGLRKRIFHDVIFQRNAKNIKPKT